MPNEENMQNNPEINTYGSGDGVEITNGPNNVDQQPSHGEDNPKYKNMGSNNPSLPREEGDTNRGMSDNDYRNPEIRTNSYYGPVKASEELTAALGETPSGNPPPDGFDTWKDYQQDQKDKKAYDQLERELKDADKRKDGGLKQDQPENKTLWTPGEIKKIQDLTAQSVRERQEKLANEEKQRLQDTLNPENRRTDTSEELRNMLAKEGLKKQEDFANDVKKELLHGEAIASNKKANEGFDPLKPLSEDGKSFFARQDEIANKAKLDAAHQDALDSNRRANEGFDPHKPLSQEGQDALKHQDELQRKLREATDPDIIDPNPELTELERRISNIELQITELQNQLNLILEKLNNVTPVNPDPIVPDPVDPDPVVPDPVDPDPVVPDPVDPDPVVPDPVDPDPIVPDPVVTPSPVWIDVPPITVINEDRDKDVITPEQERRDRNIKRGAMIAGAITGFGTVILGGTAVVPVVGGIVVGAQVATWGTKKFVEWRERKLVDKYYATSNEQERGKIMERINKWEKVRNTTEVVKRFFRGASYGVLAGSFVSGVFMGGEGVIDKIAQARAASAENFSQVSAGVHTNSTPSTPDIPSPNTPGTPTTPAPIAPQVPNPEVQLGDWFDTSKYGWDWQSYGWKGSRLALGANGGVQGGWQGDLVKSLFGNGVTENMLTNPQAGKIFSEALRSVYQGGDPTQLGQSAAEAIMNLAK